MDTLNVKLKPLDDKIMFSAVARENPEVIIDYFTPVGTGQGYTSLELLMASFGSCISTTTLTILRHKIRKVINTLSVNIDSNVKDHHPKALENMRVVMHFSAKDRTESEVRQALKVAEEGMCPVWAMLKGNVAINVAVEIDE